MKTQKLLSLLLLLTICLLVPAGLFAQATLGVTMSTTPACSTDGSATATVTGGTPPYTYYWSGPGGYAVTTVNTLSGVAGGSYYLYVRDQNQAFGNAYFSIGQPFVPSLSTTNDVCNQSIGAASCTITGGNGPFSYLWSNGQTTPNATGLGSGVYSLTVTDAMGCYITSQMDSSMYAFIFDSSPLSLSMSQTSSTCTDGTGSVTNVAGGTAPYTYVWNSVPPQYTPTATGLAPGNYQVSVTDANGCTALNQVYIYQVPNGLSGTISSTPETCLQSNGTATVSVSGGTGPYSYLWSNGATTPTITGLSYGAYSVTVTDANNCPKVKWVSVDRTDPLNLVLSTTPTNCANAGGGASVSVTGGTPPYTYQWNTGATTSSISGLSAGYYYVAVTDANGCSDYAYQDVVIPPSCMALISGSVIGDLNANCIHDNGDFGYRGRLIDLSGLWTSTNWNGDYSKSVLPGNYLVTQPYAPNYFSVACPNSGTYALPNVLAGSTYPGNDFYDQPTSTVNDLHVSFYASPARATTPQWVTIYYANNGSTTLNATINFTHDPLMTLLSGGAMTSYNVGTRTLSYNLGAISPGQFGYRYCMFTIPTNTTLGTSYTHDAEILPISIDNFPSDNVYSMTGQVVAAYDPNAKSVMPAGTLVQGVDSLLTYTIQFQNTGNDTAFTVALRDTLDGDLDPFSLEVLGASHPFNWDIDAPGYLTFTFDHIMLPDSHINEAASHGWLMYRIKLKDNLPLNSRINNRAAIYFDYNSPVLTNTTENTFGLVGVDPLDVSAAGFSLYPNPSNGQVHLQLDKEWEGTTEVRVMDLSGRTVELNTMDAASDLTLRMDLSGLPKGIYLVRCQDGSHQVVKKLAIQ